VIHTVLTSKRSYDDALVSAVWDDIGAYVTRAEAEAAVDTAAAELSALLGRQTARARRAVAYGWSGGKDSQALRVVCEKAGVVQAVIGLIPPVEWEAYLDWIGANAPPGLWRFENNTVNLPWLALHPHLVFPATGTLGYWWTLAGTRKAQVEYTKKVRPPFLIYGRRYQDGNQIRSALGPGLDPALGGGVSYCPLRDWPHEMVLAVCHYFGMSLPPVYSWPHGWSSGTGAWPGRRPGGWAETYAIQPGAVVQAARYMPAARDFLAGQS